MKDSRKTKKQLLAEIEILRARVSELESSETDGIQGAVSGESVRDLTKALFDTHVLVAYLDKDFNFIGVNKAYADAGGHSPEFFVGKNHFDLYPHEENETIFRQVVETGEPYSVHAKPFTYKDYPQGGQTYWDWSLIPEKEATGKVKGLVFCLVDVTRRVMAEEELRKSEERYRLHFQNVGDVIYITDLQLRVSSVSPSIEALIGYRPDEIIGRRVDELNVLAPECYETAVRNTRRVLSGQKSGPTEYTFILKDGTKKIGEVIGAPLYREGKVVGVISVARDITARKQTERELQKYRDHLEDMVAARTAELTAMNEQLQLQIAECRQMEIALGREAEINSVLADLSKALIRKATISEISTLVLDCARNMTSSLYGYAGYIDPDNGALVCPTMSREIWNVCQIPGKDVVFEKFGGLWGWVLKNRKPLLANSVENDPRSTGLPEGHIPIQSFLSVPALIGGRLVGQLAVANSAREYSQQDLALLERLGNLFAIAIHREQGEEELRKSEARYRHLSQSLEEAVRQKVAELRQAESLAAIGRMVSVMAHEVRNPLQSIHMGFEEIKKTVGTDHTVSEILAEVEYGIDLLNGIIDELLDYSRPIRLNSRPTFLPDIAKKALTSLSGRLENITVHFEVGQNREVYVDSDLMFRVFVNLISNAIDAMEGRGELKITSQILDGEDGGFIKIAFTDNGCGIEEENLKRVQEPFFTTKTFGTGLGMPICRKIVGAHNGSVTVTSRSGVGTTVEIVLPIQSS